MLHAVHLEAVGLEGAALREGLLAQVAFVWTHSYKEEANVTC